MCYLSFKHIFNDYLWLLKCCKNTFLYSIFFLSKNYTYFYSIKKIFLFCKNFVIQRKYSYIQSTYACNQTYENIYFYSIKKKICLMKFFYSMIFGSQIWSSLCQWNSLKLLHVLYSDFNARVNHKSKPYLTALALKFVFCLRGVKYTFTGSGFVLDLIIALHRRNLGFFFLAA